ncbi:1,2-phenylacetyl-CoA epoxidase subunit PaaC [Shouchella miscanthi]|uniref:1,2-phenylacetyl-CoA epoxidase subunit PaaC n=1 Tax=Shouchella miscanthi TaxID=2598861 RepID=UPI0011A90190|nr:1,2-phenylacetyl-CoA epoxidase subunit PaaC [Shouchella miscanthi]
MSEHELSDVEREALTELLLQLGDDDFIYAFRGAEWLGLAPHIEEDVASASISQNSMGHAVMFYELAGTLGLSEANVLAHGREANERKNSILLERVNGEGSYMGTPTFDWAYTVVRNYFYTLAKKLKMDALQLSTYGPLVDVAKKVNMELHYHLLHWRTWFIQLSQSTDEAKTRMTLAIKKVMQDFGDLIHYGDWTVEIEKKGYSASAKQLEQKWLSMMNPIVTSLGFDETILEYELKQNGRDGQHTEDLHLAIATFSEVYQTDPVATW